MVGAPGGLPRGLAARIVWLGLALYDRLRRADDSPPARGGGNVETTACTPAPQGEEPPRMEAHCLTHTGRRPRNEDAHHISEALGIAVVADGFCGAHGGDVASRLAVEEIAAWFEMGPEHTVPHFEPADLEDGMALATMRFALERAHRRIRHHADRFGPSGMTCAAAALVLAGSRVVIGQAGDVRVFRARAGVLAELTTEPGSITFSGPLGARDPISPRLHAEPWHPGDVYLLCSGGLHHVLGQEVLRWALSTDAALQHVAATLVGRALHSGAAENLTAVIVKPLGSPDGTG